MNCQRSKQEAFNFIKMESLEQVFSSEFRDILENAFPYIFNI